MVVFAEEACLGDSSSCGYHLRELRIAMCPMDHPKYHNWSSSGLDPKSRSCDRDNLEENAGSAEADHHSQSCSDAWLHRCQKVAKVVAGRYVTVDGASETVVDY
jgi:hypothetical protein